MTSLRLVIAASLASLFAFSALAQSTQGSPPQAGQGGYTCSSKNKPAATS